MAGRRRVARAARVMGVLLLALLATGVALLVGTVVVLRSQWGQRKVLERVERMAGDVLAGGASVGSASVSASGEIELREVVVRDAEGQEAVYARRVRLRLLPSALLDRVVRVQHAQAEGMRVRVRRLRSGTWNLASLGRPQVNGEAAPPVESSRWRVEAPEVTADGMARIEDLPPPAGRGANVQVNLAGAITWRAPALPPGARVPDRPLPSELSRNVLSIDLRRADVVLLDPVPTRARIAGRATFGDVVRLDGVTVEADTRGEALAKRFRDLPLRGPIHARAEGGFDGRAATTRFSIRPAAGSIDGEARATLDGRRWRWQVDVRAARLTPSRSLARSVVSGPAAVLADATIDASARAGGESGRYRVALSSLVASARGARVEARGHLASNGDLELRVDGQVAELGAATRAALRSSRSAATVPAAAGSASLHAELRRRGHGPLTTDVQLHAKQLAIAGARATRLDGTARFVGLTGQGVLSAEGVAAGGVELERLRAELRGDRRGLVARIDAQGPTLLVSLAAHGAPRRRGKGFDATLDALRVTVGDSAWRATAPAQVAVATGAAPMVSIQGLSLASGGQRLVLDARLDRGRRPSVQARIGLQRIDLVPLVERVRPGLAARHGFADVPVPLDGELRVTGRLDAPAIGLDLTASAARPGKPAVTVGISGGYHGARSLAQGHIALAGTPLLRFEAQLDADLARDLLRHTPLDGEVRGRVWTDGYDLTRLRCLGQAPPDLEGRIGVQAQIAGRLRDPSMDLTLTADGLGSGGLRFGHVTGKASYTGGRLRASLTAPQAGGGTLVAVGELRRDEGTIAARIDANGLALGFLARSAGPVLVTEGRLDAHLAISGSASRPVLAGELGVTGGAFALRAEGHRYSGVELRARLWPEDHGARTRLVLQRLELHSGEGVARATGDVVLAGLRPQAIDLTVDAERFALTLGGTLVTRLDGRFHAVGNARDDAMVGRIIVEKGSLRLPSIAEQATGRKLQSVGPLEDVEFVDPAGRLEAERQRAASTPLPLLVDVAVPGGFTLLGKDVSTDFAGKLRLVARGSSLRIEGRLRADGGWVEVLGKRFRVERARFVFIGREDGGAVDPDIEVQLRRVVGDVTVIIDLTGTARRPAISLSSDPPRYDETEVLSLLLQGDPSAGPVDQTSLENSVVGALSGLLVNRIKDNLLPSLPVDVVRIDTGAAPAGASPLSTPTTRVEVGKYITPRIYVSYVHQFFASPQILQRANANQATVEWRFARHFELETTYGDAGVGGMDFSFRYRF